MKITLLVCLLALVNLAQFDKPEKDKDKLKRPAEITLRANLARVRSVMLADYARDGWQVENDTESTLVFSRVGGPKSIVRFLYGPLARTEDRFTLIERDGAVLVIADLGLMVPADSGPNLERRDWNRDKKARQRIEEYFTSLKEQAEATKP